MTQEIWTVDCDLAGEFVVTDERRESREAPTDGLRELALGPAMGDDGKWNGLHHLHAVFRIENNANGPLSAQVAFEAAKAIVDQVGALASLSIGRPVVVQGGIAAKRRLADEPPTYRFVTRAIDSRTVGPRTPLVVSLLTMSLDSRLRRVIRWWARGVAAEDAVDSLVSLTNALDLLAGMVDGAPGRTRKCPHCGAEDRIGPGLRERVIHYLQSRLGYEESAAAGVYETRLDLAHARSDLGEDDLRKYRRQAKMLVGAIRSGIASELGVTLPELPTHLPVDEASALLDVTCQEPPADAAPRTVSV